MVEIRFTLLCRCGSDISDTVPDYSYIKINTVAAIRFDGLIGLV